MILNMFWWVCMHWVSLHMLPSKYLDQEIDENIDIEFIRIDFPCINGIETERLVASALKFNDFQKKSK